MGLGQRLRWWTFFVTKSALVVFGSCLLAWVGIHLLADHLIGSVYPMADGVALWLFLILSIAPLSWAIHDQKMRCRVCLRSLGIPIRTGAPGNVLFNWSGTEMVCPEGHGILYLPDSEAKWLEGDRWNNLDNSWADLFRDRVVLRLPAASMNLRFRTFSRLTTGSAAPRPGGLRWRDPRR